METDDEGHFVGYLDFDPAVLAALGFETIMEYGYYLAGEVAEDDLAAFRRNAASLELLYEVRRDFDLIQVNGYTFSSFGEPTGLPPSLTIDEYEGDIGMYLVQLKAPMTPTWWRALEAAGAVVGYVPQNTYILRANKADLPVLRLVNGVQHVSLYQPAYKVRRSLFDWDKEVEVDVEFDGEQDLAAAAAAIRDLIGREVTPGQIGRFGYARLKATPANRTLILRRPEVIWVEPALHVRYAGERNATTVSGSHDGLKPTRYGTDGHHEWLRDRGFCTPTVADPNCMVYWTKVGVVDTGLDKTICLSYSEDTGVCTSWSGLNKRHPDLNHNSNLSSPCQGKAADCVGPVIFEKIFCADDSLGHNQCDDSYGNYDFSDEVLFSHGHGTAVVSLIVGDPLSIGMNDPTPEWDPPGLFLRGTGIAPSAQIIVAKNTVLQSDNPFAPSGMTADTYEELVAHLSANDARIVNNSWNLYLDNDPQNPDTYEDRYGWEYTLFSKVADRLVRDADGSFDDDHSQTTLVFSAGNWKTFHGETWVRSPANAKNVLSVGASVAWAEVGKPADNECNNQTNSVIEDIADFSRRGYVAESTPAGSSGPRYKPDLVAPGSLQIAAARSQHSSVSDIYKCFSGTSAAAPQVTAAAVLAEAWYHYKYVDEEALPSPAMIRAMLIAHADSLFGGKDYLYSPAEDLGHSPSLPQGWGRVNLDETFQDPTTIALFDQDYRPYGGVPDPPPIENRRRFTASGQDWSTVLEVVDPQEPIIAVMVFTDRYSWPTAGSLVVNDLDLTLTPHGLTSHPQQFFGNYFEDDSEYSEEVTGFLPAVPRDEMNTVEVIRVEAGVITTASIRVKVKARAISGKAVKGLDGSNPNQDFALYVWNAAIP